MEKLSTLVSDGGIIKWVGYHGKRTVWVHILIHGSISKLIVPLKEDYSESWFKDIEASSADVPGSVRGTIWGSNTRLDLLRLASILGINVGGSATPACGQEFRGFAGCTMAYDIESDRSRIPSSSFGTVSEAITSLATYCSCGDTRVFSFVPSVDYKYTLCNDSMDTVTKFLEYVTHHQPQWLLGYNNFGYDNTRIAYHSKDVFDSILIPMKVGMGSSMTYAYYIDIAGVYNVDLLVYLDKTRRSEYENMTLSTVVKHHKIDAKMNFDTGSVYDFVELFRYNLHDSKITLQLAEKSNVLWEMAFLSNAACCPIIDSARFVSGTFAACAIAAYCLQRGIRMDWSPCTEVKEYKGAHVMEPIIGLHEDVYSCDFSSMYPSVVLGSNISIENVTETNTIRLDGSTWRSSTTTNFAIDGRRISFNLYKDCIIPPVMKLFVDRRKGIKNQMKVCEDNNKIFLLHVLQWALKIIANSIYGSIGDRNSHIYSPACSAAVTTGGRWCLAVADSIMRACHYKVVYGDTDSCQVSMTKKAKWPIQDVTRILSMIFEYTPFPGMNMEVEGRYSKIAYLGKKTYFGRLSNGSIVSKGMSKSRKDRIGICRILSSIMVPLLLDPHMDNITILTITGDMVTYVADMATNMGLNISEVSKIIKKGGSNYYDFRSISGDRVSMECETVHDKDYVEYSPKEVIKLTMREVKLLLSITGTGSISSAIRMSSIL